MKLRASLLLITFFALSTSLVSAGDPTLGKTKASLCAACHGADGNSTNPEWPKLAGQHASYIIRQTLAIRSGEDRVNALMAPMVADLSAEDLADIAAYFETKNTTYVEAINEDKKRVAELLYRGGDQSRDIPACMGCHGPDGRGNGLAKFPSLRGQHAKYTVVQLNAYRDKKRITGTIMPDIAKRLEPFEIEALAAYLSALH